MFRYQQRGPNRTRTERNPPHEHAGQMTLGLSDDAATGRRTNPAPPEPVSAPRARRADPVTSKEAAAKAGSLAGAHYVLILTALEKGPAQIYELGARAGLSHVQVARRMLELESQKRAHPTGERRDGCRLWALGPKPVET